MVEGVFDAATSPITKVAEIAKKGENNTTKAAEVPPPPAEGNQPAANGANNGEQPQVNKLQATYRIRRCFNEKNTEK